jgi:hypothetical protein
VWRLNVFGCVLSTSSTWKSCTVGDDLPPHLQFTPSIYSLGHLLWGNLPLGHLGQCLGRFLDIIGQDPSVSKPNRLWLERTNMYTRTLHFHPCLVIQVPLIQSRVNHLKWLTLVRVGPSDTTSAPPALAPPAPARFSSLSPRYSPYELTGWLFFWRTLSDNQHVDVPSRQLHQHILESALLQAGNSLNFGPEFLTYLCQVRCGGPGVGTLLKTTASNLHLHKFFHSMPLRVILSFTLSSIRFPAEECSETIWIPAGVNDFLIWQLGFVLNVRSCESPYSWRTRLSSFQVL